MSIEKLLNSKLLHWITIILMVMNISGYITAGSIECIIVFAIGYYVSNYFTKKYQSLDILAGLFAANMVFGCGRIKEGLENSSLSQNPPPHHPLSEKDKEKKEN